MEEDPYNPFCIDGIDPLSLPSSSGKSSHSFAMQQPFKGCRVKYITIL